MATNGPVTIKRQDETERQSKARASYPTLYGKNAVERITVVVPEGLKLAVESYAKASGMPTATALVKTAVALFIGWDETKEIARPDARKRHTEEYKKTRKEETDKARKIVLQPTKHSKDDLQWALAIFQKYESDRRS